MFHTLAGCAADRLVAPADPSAAYALVYRGLTHTRIREACEEVRKPTMKALVRVASRRSIASADLIAFADVLVPLQQLRHLADYHPTSDFMKLDVMSLADDVEAR